MSRARRVEEADVNFGKIEIQLFEKHLNFTFSKTEDEKLHEPSSLRRWVLRCKAFILWTTRHRYPFQIQSLYQLTFKIFTTILLSITFSLLSAKGLLFPSYFT